MKTWRWLVGSAAVLLVMSALRAQTPEPLLPRPGAVFVSYLAGEAFITIGEQRKPIKFDDRLRVGSILTTGRKTLLTLAFSNGTSLELGSDSEVELEEFGQAPVSSSIKFQELKEEPTISRTRLRLVRGEVTVEVKPLKVSRGSTFVLNTPAGNVRTGAGRLQAMVRMSDLGLGVCAVELQKGAAEIEPPGQAFAPMGVERKLVFALEVDRVSGATKVGEMPKVAAPAK